MSPWLRDRGMPYAGFSAGAAVAADRATLGGWRLHVAGRTRNVCPEEAAGGLDEVRVVAGLGLAPFCVEAHASEWGTVSRLAAGVDARVINQGWAVDEDTMLEICGGQVRVHGLGRAFRVTRQSSGVHLDAFDSSSAPVPLAQRENVAVSVP